MDIPFLTDLFSVHITTKEIEKVIRLVLLILARKIL